MYVGDLTPTEFLEVLDQTSTHVCRFVIPHVKTRVFARVRSYLKTSAPEGIEVPGLTNGYSIHSLRCQFQCPKPASGFSCSAHSCSKRAGVISKALTKAAASKTQSLGSHALLCSVPSSNTAIPRRQMVWNTIALFNPLWICRVNALMNSLSPMRNTTNRMRGNVGCFLLNCVCVSPQCRDVCGQIDS